MTLHKLLIQFASYNHWANQRVIDWLKKYPEATVSRDTLSSYPTIPKTLYHIWIAQLIYLSILEESELIFPVEPAYDKIMKELSKSSTKLVQVVKKLGSDGLEETRYISRPGIKGDYPVFEFVLHCLNHSTYHRGQVITMGRSLGLDSPPVTDYYRFSMSV